MQPKKTLTLALAAAIAAAALTLAACVRFVDADAARVDCGTPGPHGVDCKIKRTAGSSGFEACWALVISCQNGGGMTGSACQKVSAAEDEGSKNMPVAGFSNQNTCDVPTAGKVERLKVTTLKSP